MTQTESASLEKFAVSYTIPCEHRVSVGVTATAADEAIARVREAVDAGTVRDDTAEMPLLEDRHVEHPPAIEGDVAKHLVIGATRVAGEFEIHPSVDQRLQRSFAHAPMASGDPQPQPIEASPAATATPAGTIDQQRAAAESLDAACTLVQKHLGVTSANVAAIYLSRSEVEKIFAAVRACQSLVIDWQRGEDRCGSIHRKVVVRYGETPRHLDPLSYRREVPAAELDRHQVLTVDLRSCGNIDMGQDPNRPLFGIPTDPWHPVQSLAEAGLACRDFIERYGLGSSQWGGGWVRDGADAIVAHVSYNGRVWFLNET